MQKNQMSQGRSATRSKTIFTLSIAFFLFLVFFAFNAKAESIVPEGVEHGESFSVDVKINSDSTVSITENLSYDFGNQTKSGPTRYIPLNYQDLIGKNVKIDIADVSVEDENGSPIIFKQSKYQSEDKKSKYIEIKIGDESQVVSGLKNYIIKYKATGAIKFGSDRDEFYWNMAGDKWPVYLRHPEITISLPQRVEKENVNKECFIGIHKATVACIDYLGSKKDLVADYIYKGLVAGEGMTTVVSFPKGIVSQKTSIEKNVWNSLKNDSNLQRIILMAVLILITLCVVVIKYYKNILDFAKERIYPKLLSAGKKIKLHRVHAHAKKHVKKLKSKSRKWWISLAVFLVAIVSIGIIIFWKIDTTLNKISVKGESVGSIVQATLPNQSNVKSEEEDQINILLLGILGANHPGGGLNTDTIMVASIQPRANKISMVSIPRDLWVTDPGKETKSKINAVYMYGEEKGSGQGIEDIESLIGQITGLTIHYTAVVSTQGFSQLVDTLGGVDINLTKPFNETAQFDDVKVCDNETYTVPTGEFETKKNKKKKIVAQYPLCKNNNPECGGDFHLPAGKSTLGGQKALCFVRSRYLTSDFERAKRQQLILQQLKLKVTELNITDFGKLNSILDNLGDNVQTNMQLWEMRRLFDLYKGMDNTKIYQRVLEDSKEGLLYSPDSTPETGYILLPRGDNYDSIRELFHNIFNSQNQSDIKPKI